MIPPNRPYVVYTVYNLFAVQTQTICRGDGSNKCCRVSGYTKNTLCTRFNISRSAQEEVSTLILLLNVIATTSLGSRCVIQRSDLKGRYEICLHTKELTERRIFYNYGLIPRKYPVCILISNFSTY